MSQEIFFRIFPAGDLPEGKINFDAQGKAFFYKRDYDGQGDAVMVFGVQAFAGGGGRFSRKDPRESLFFLCPRRSGGKREILSYICFTGCY